MLRSGGAASLSRASLRCVSSTSARTTRHLPHASILSKQAPRSIGAQNRATFALILHKPLSTSLQRYATHPGGPFDKIDTKHEEVVEHEKMVPHPEEVSESSSVHQVFHEKGVEEQEADVDMLAGVKSDLVRFLCFPSLRSMLIIGAAENYQRNFRSR